MLPAIAISSGEQGRGGENCPPIENHCFIAIQNHIFLPCPRLLPELIKLSPSGDVTMDSKGMDCSHHTFVSGFLGEPTSLQPSILGWAGSVVVRSLTLATAETCICAGCRPEGLGRDVDKICKVFSELKRVFLSHPEIVSKDAHFWSWRQRENVPGLRC